MISIFKKNFLKTLVIIGSLLLITTSLLPIANSSRTYAANTTEVDSIKATPDTINTLGSTVLEAHVVSNGDPNFLTTPIVFTIPSEFNVTALPTDPNGFYECSSSVDGAGVTTVTCTVTASKITEINNSSTKPADAFIQIGITAKDSTTIPVTEVVNPSVTTPGQTIPVDVPVTINPINAEAQPIAKSTTGATQNPGTVENPQTPGSNMDGWGDGGRSQMSDGSWVQNNSTNFAWHIWLNQPGNAANANGFMQSGVASLHDSLGTNLSFVGTDISSPETDLFIQYGASNSETAPEGRLTRVTDPALVTPGSHNYYIQATDSNSFTILFDFDSSKEYFFSYRTQLIDPNKTPDLTNENQATFTDAGNNSYDTEVYAYHELPVTTGVQILQKTATVTPKENLGDLKIVKTDDVTGDPLAGAVFSVTGPNGYTNSVTTGADGTVTIVDLTPGDYTVTETAAPAGYNLDPTPKTATVTSIVPMTGMVGEGDIIHYRLAVDTKNMTASSGKVLRDILPTNVTYVPNSLKAPVAPAFGLDGVTPNTAPKNIKYTVSEPSGTKNILDVTINEDLGNNAHFYIDFDVTVNPGTYGQRIDNLFTYNTGVSETIHHSIDEEAAKHPVAVVNMTNAKTQYGAVLLQKLISNASPDANATEDAKLAQGIEFTLINNATNETFTGVTDSNGQILFPSVPYGNYTLKETKTPLYLSVIADRQITIDATTLNKAGVVGVDLEVTDAILYSKITVSKFDKSNNNRVSGMKFSIKNVETGQVQEFDMGKANVFEVDYVPVGTYEVTETAAPAGYKIDPTVRTVKVTKDGENITLDFYDEPENGTVTPPKEVVQTSTPSGLLPDTGAQNIDASNSNYLTQTLLAFTVVISIITVFVVRRKKSN